MTPSNRARLQDVVIRTSPWPPFRWGYAAVYGAALLWLVARLRRIPEIRAVAFRPPHRGHCFGSSDLDLRALTAPLTAREFFALADRLADVLLPGGTWLRIFDLYAFPEAEYALKSMVGSQSIVRDRRWIRLLGPPPPDGAASPEPEDAFLGRATYECAAMDQDLFEGTLDLHRTRLVYGRVLRIDGELRARGVRAGVPESIEREVLAAAAGPALRGRVRRASFELLARAHMVALSQTTALARHALERLPRGVADSTVAAVEPAAVPDTLAVAIHGCRDAIVELCAAAKGAIQSAIIGGVPASRYEYRIYLIVRDDLTADAHVALCRTLRALFAANDPRIPYAFFRLRAPAVLTRDIWRASGRWYHALRSVEEHYFLQRHGLALWGDDVRGDLTPPSRSAVVRSAAVAVADLRNRIWGALHHRKSKQLADLVAGRVPALWLVLARSLVATSPREAVQACAEHGFPHAAVLAELDRHLAGRVPEDLPHVDDPVWEPALDALTDWLDDLAALALAASRAPAPDRGGQDVAAAS